MSSKDVDLLRQAYADLSLGDVDAVVAVLAHDFEIHLPEGGISAGTITGHKAVAEFLWTYVEAFESFQVTPERFFEAGERVVAFCHMRGLGRSSGVEVEVRPAQVWTIRAGKPTRVDVFPERQRASALESVGLGEAPG